MTSIIIPVYNQWELTEACLESIQDWTPGPYEVIIIDNGSQEDIAEQYVRWRNERPSWHKYHPQINRTLTHNPTNLGYPAAVNQGIALATGDTICLLNNDTEPGEGWLAAMLRVLDEHPEVGIVGPMSDNVSGLQGMQVHPLHPGSIIETQRLVGFCMLLRRSVVDRIGGFDTRIGLGNFDDDDYCVRATLAGFKLAIAVDSFVHHVGGATFRAENIDYQALLERNWVLMKEKWGIPMDLPLGGEITMMIDTEDLDKYNVPLDAGVTVS